MSDRHKTKLEVAMRHLANIIRDQGQSDQLVAYAGRLALSTQTNPDYVKSSSAFREALRVYNSIARRPLTDADARLV